MFFFGEKKTSSTQNNAVCFVSLSDLISQNSLQSCNCFPVNFVLHPDTSFSPQFSVNPYPNASTRTSCQGPSCGRSCIFPLDAGTEEINLRQLPSLRPFCSITRFFLTVSFCLMHRFVHKFSIHIYPYFFLGNLTGIVLES
jgi:hypothetical protein